LNILEAIVAEN